MCLLYVGQLDKTNVKSTAVAVIEIQIWKRECYVKAEFRLCISVSWFYSCYNGGHFEYLILSPSQRRNAPFRALARGEGTNSARLFTPGKSKALLAKSEVAEVGRHG